MPNNVINKVVFDGRTLIDLTNTTATASTILSGVGAYGADGVWVDGTAQLGAENGDIYQDEEGYLVLASGAATNINVTSLSVTSNGVYTAPSGVAYTPVNVNVGPARSAADITVSGPNVSGPAGLYSEAFSKAVSIGSATVQNHTFTDEATLQLNENTGVVTAGDKSINIDIGIKSSNFVSGYISRYSDIASGVFTYIRPSKTIELPTKTAATYTPTETIQTISSYQWLTGAQTIAAISSTYIGTGVDRQSSANMYQSGWAVYAPMGYYSSDARYAIPRATHLAPVIDFRSSTGIVYANHDAFDAINSKKLLTGAAVTSSSYSLSILSANTYTPGASDQIISRYQWLTGSQTILGDVNLISENIKSGVSIFGVMGELSGGGNLGTTTVFASDTVQTIDGMYGNSVIFERTVNNYDPKVILSSSANPPYWYVLIDSPYSFRNLTIGDTYNLYLELYYGLAGSISYLTNAISVSFMASNTSRNSIYFNTAISEPFVFNGIYLSDQYIRFYYNDSEPLLKYGDTMAYRNYIRNIGLYRQIDTDGLSSIIINPYANDKYSGIYKTIANLQSVHADLPFVSEWADSFTIISGNGCVVQSMFGDFVFDNCNSIYAFGFAGAGKAYLPSATASFPVCSNLEHEAFIRNCLFSKLYFPILSSISYYAFMSAKLREIYCPECSFIEYSAFENCLNLSSVYFPNCKTVSSWAFHSCKSLPFLNSTNFPKVETIGMEAFGFCTVMSYVDLSLCNSISGNAFSGCGRMVSVSLPALSIVSNSVFTNCTSLNQVFLPSCVSIGNNAFSGCTALESIDLPNCTTISNYAFFSCYNLSNISIPNCTSLGSCVFMQCRNLSTITIINVSLFSASVFASCYNLLSVYLLNSSVATMSNTNMFSSTPISTYTTSTGGVYGSIYVPLSLYSDYITATNWKVYSSRFASLTDAEIEALLA